MRISVPLESEKSIQWCKELQALDTPSAQARFIELMKTSQRDNLTVDDFRDRIVLTLDVAKIPTSTVADATGIAPGYLERYIIGSTCIQAIRSIICEAIASLDPAAIPQFLPEDKALRAVDKMVQLALVERNLLFRKHIESSSFDWSNDVVFGRLVSFAVDSLKYSEYTLAKEMRLSDTFLASWRQPKTMPLPITRRRFINTLHVATYSPLPTT